MKKDSSFGRLLSILVLFGFVNITIAYSFFYYSSITLLEERGTQQMAAVRAQASEKLRLYFQHLKSLAFQVSEESGQLDAMSPELSEALVSVNKEKGGRPGSLVFRETADGNISLRVPAGKITYAWIFNYKGINRLLSERVGLGQTGEIYLVGRDNKILTQPRHTGPHPVKLINDSTRLGSQEKFGVHIVRDYRNVEVLSAYSPFRLDNLSFVLLSEIDREEIINPLSAMLPRVYFLCAVLCLITVGLVFFAGKEILLLIDGMKAKINDFHLQLITTLEEEKRSVSVNLHDGVGQIITALKWGITGGEGKDRLKELCDEAVREIRTVSYNLMPSELSQLGLFSAVKNDFRKHQEFYRIEMNYWFNEKLTELKFREGIDVNIYRMIQELVQNTIKHAKATTVSLVIFREQDHFVLRYEDNGIGMKENSPMPKVLMYRSELMGGTIQRPMTAKGVVFKIEIPMEKVFHGNS